MKMPDAMKIGRRTQRELAYSPEKWNLIDSWATTNRYQKVEEADNRILYKRRLGWTMPPTFIEMVQEKKRIKLDFWVKADAYLVVSLLTFKDPEIRLDRGGMSAMLPRKKARVLVNNLLDTLKLPHII